MIVDIAATCLGFHRNKKGLDSKKDGVKTVFSSLGRNYILVPVSKNLNCDTDFCLRGNFVFSSSSFSNAAGGATIWCKGHFHESVLPPSLLLAGMCSYELYNYLIIEWWLYFYSLFKTDIFSPEFSALVRHQTWSVQCVFSIWSHSLMSEKQEETINNFSANVKDLLSISWLNKILYYSMQSEMEDFNKSLTALASLDHHCFWEKNILNGEIQQRYKSLVTAHSHHKWSCMVLGFRWTTIDSFHSPLSAERRWETK